MASDMRDFWDSQFKFSAILPDFDATLERMKVESDRFAAGHTLDRSRYGDHSRQWVEWVAGHGPQDSLAVVIHGGYWRALEAETHRFVMPAWVKHAGAVANVEYRLVPEVSLAEVVADAKAALRALIARLPSRQLVLIGHSAGAHLALSAMSEPDLKAHTKGILALSGVYDLSPVAQSFVQDELNLTAADIAQFSLHPDADRPPVLFVNGSRETHEFLRGSALMAAGPNADWVLLDGADHMTLLQAAADNADTLMTKLQHLKDRQ